jgi:hypothetical protein
VFKVQTCECPHGARVVGAIPKSLHSLLLYGTEPRPSILSSLFSGFPRLTSFRSTVCLCTRPLFPAPFVFQSRNCFATTTLVHSSARCRDNFRVQLKRPIPCSPKLTTFLGPCNIVSTQSNGFWICYRVITIESLSARALDSPFSTFLPLIADLEPAGEGSRIYTIHLLNNFTFTSLNIHNGGQLVREP